MSNWPINSSDINNYADRSQSVRAWWLSINNCSRRGVHPACYHTLRTNKLTTARSTITNVLVSNGWLVIVNAVGFHSIWLHGNSIFRDHQAIAPIDWLSSPSASKTTQIALELWTGCIGYWTRAYRLVVGTLYVRDNWRMGRPLKPCSNWIPSKLWWLQLGFPIPTEGVGAGKPHPKRPQSCYQLIS